MNCLTCGDKVDRYSPDKMHCSVVCMAQDRARTHVKAPRIDDRTKNVLYPQNDTSCVKTNPRSE